MKLRLKVYKRGSKCLHGGEINGRFYFHFIDVEEIFQKLLMTAEKFSYKWYSAKLTVYFKYENICRYTK